MIQHLIVLALVAGCLGAVGFKAYRTLLGKKGGACGCEGCPVGDKATAPAASDNKPKIVFIPSENLGLRIRGR